MAAQQKSPLVVARRVIHALLMREILTRFGSYRLGALWLILDPLIQVGVFVLLFAGILNRVMPNVDYAVYLATGLVPWLMFGDIINRGMSSVSSNKGLFSFREVKPIDAFFARVFLEVLIYFFVFLIVMIFLSLMGHKIYAHRPLEVFSAYLMIAYLGAGLSLFFMCIQTFFPEVKKAISVVMRFLYLISGVIMPLSAIPSEYRGYLNWNPLLHAMELARESFFPAFHAVSASWVFLFVSSMIVGLVASIAFSVSKRRMLA